ncbi:MAG TPA: hypothetical protein VHM67_01080 [Gemmatimonadaceae bacterium]|nr:hypothetical protein [Gemmatimonadaceae bacterium]
MAQLTHRQYEVLEHAIATGTRVAVMRRGTEYVIVPRRLRLEQGREAVDSVHPTTGHTLTLYVDEFDSVEMVK